MKLTETAAQLDALHQLAVVFIVLAVIALIGQIVQILLLLRQRMNDNEEEKQPIQPVPRPKSSAVKQKKRVEYPKPNEIAAHNAPCRELFVDVNFDSSKQFEKSRVSKGKGEKKELIRTKSSESPKSEDLKAVMDSYNTPPRSRDRNKKQVRFASSRQDRKKKETRIEIEKTQMDSVAANDEGTGAAFTTRDGTMKPKHYLGTRSTSDTAGRGETLLETSHFESRYSDGATSASTNDFDRTCSVSGATMNANEADLEKGAVEKPPPVESNQKKDDVDIEKQSVTKSSGKRRRRRRTSVVKPALNVEVKNEEAAGNKVEEKDDDSIREKPPHRKPKKGRVRNADDSLRGYISDHEIVEVPEPKNDQRKMLEQQYLRKETVTNEVVTKGVETTDACGNDEKKKKADDASLSDATVAVIEDTPTKNQAPRSEYTSSAQATSTTVTTSCATSTPQVTSSAVTDTSKKTSATTPQKPKAKRYVGPCRGGPASTCSLEDAEYSATGTMTPKHFSSQYSSSSEYVTDTEGDLSRSSQFLYENGPERDAGEIIVKEEAQVKEAKNSGEDNVVKIEKKETKTTTKKVTTTSESGKKNPVDASEDDKLQYMPDVPKPKNDVAETKEKKRKEKELEYMSEGVAQDQAADKKKKEKEKKCKEAEQENERALEYMPPAPPSYDAATKSTQKEVRQTIATTVTTSQHKLRKKSSERHAPSDEANDPLKTPMNRSASGEEVTPVHFRSEYSTTVAPSSRSGSENSVSRKPTEEVIREPPPPYETQTEAVHAKRTTTTASSDATDQPMTSADSSVQHHFRVIETKKLSDQHSAADPPPSYKNNSRTGANVVTEVEDFARTRRKESKMKETREAQVEDVGRIRPQKAERKQMEEVEEKKISRKYEKRVEKRERRFDPFVTPPKRREVASEVLAEPLEPEPKPQRHQKKSGLSYKRTTEEVVEERKCIKEKEKADCKLKESSSQLLQKPLAPILSFAPSGPRLYAADLPEKAERPVEKKAAPSEEKKKTETKSVSVQKKTAKKVRIREATPSNTTTSPGAATQLDDCSSCSCACVSTTAQHTDVHCHEHCTNDESYACDSFACDHMEDVCESSYYDDCTTHHATSATVFTTTTVTDCQSSCSCEHE